MKRANRYREAAALLEQWSNEPGDYDDQVMTVLAGMIDRQGKRYVVGSIYGYPGRELLARVYGKTIKEMRERKRACAAILQAMAKADAQILPTG